MAFASIQLQALAVRHVPLLNWFLSSFTAPVLFHLFHDVCSAFSPSPPLPCGLNFVWVYLILSCAYPPDHLLALWHLQPRCVDFLASKSKAFNWSGCWVSLVLDSWVKFEWLLHLPNIECKQMQTSIIRYQNILACETWDFLSQILIYFSKLICRSRWMRHN